MTTASQLDLFTAPLPVQSYGKTPHRASDTSAAGAKAITPKVGGLQRRVLLALLEMPGLTHAGLDRVMGTEASRAARPRCTELKLAGYVEEAGRCKEESGVLVAMWQLTDAGEALALSLKAVSA